MVRIQLENVNVEFPVYQARALSFKHTLLRTVGGRIGAAKDSGRIVVKALQNIDLGLREGDILALVGHNGAGKSTLLRVMAGIYRPSSGRVICDGLRLPLFDTHSGFDEEATGYENILQRGLLMGMARPELEARIEEIAAFSGLGDFLDLPLRTYSAGMVLRLQFSVATCVPSDILLMDEWLTTGDEDFMDRANRRLEDFVGRASIVALASHNAALLRRVCNRAILLEAGSIKMTGSVEAVLDAYSAHKVE